MNAISRRWEAAVQSVVALVVGSTGQRKSSFQVDRPVAYKSANVSYPRPPTLAGGNRLAETSLELAFEISALIGLCGGAQTGTTDRSMLQGDSQCGAVEVGSAPTRKGGASIPAAVPDSLDKEVT